MKAKGISKFLACLNAKNITVEKDWLRCSCPLAPWTHTKGVDNNPSFAIRIVENGESYFNCWSCGGGKSLESLIGKLRMNGARPPKYQLGQAMDVVLHEMGDLDFALKSFDEAEAGDPGVEIVEFPKMWLDSFLLAKKVKVACKYLHGRGLNEETMDFFDIRWDSDRETVCFPIYGADAAILGLHGRYLNPIVKENGGTIRYHSYASGMGDRNKSAWLGEWYVRDDIPVVVVEGMFDVAAIWPVYPNVITPLVSGMNPAKIARMRYRLGQVITFFDHGKAGDKARTTMASAFGSGVIANIIPEEGEDPGDYSYEKMAKTLDPYL